MTPINSLRKECERNQQLAVEARLRGEDELAVRLDNNVNTLSLLMNHFNLETFELLITILAYTGEMLDEMPTGYCRQAYSEFYRSLAVVCQKRTLSLEEEKRNEVV